MGRLLIVHFSDLHIGSELLGTGRSWPFTGLNGHQLMLCEHLQTAFIDGKRRATVKVDFNLQPHERLHFVLSGDLTRVGSVNDFYLSYAWLLDKWTLPNLVNPPKEVGLRIPSSDLYSVPGNHDQWEGETPHLWNAFSPRAYNANLSPTWFRETPWHSEIHSPDGDFIFDLFGVDSNSGLAGETGSTFAEGALSDAELSKLESELIQSKSDETADGIPRIRAVVCHHSFYGRGWVAGLRSRSADALKRVMHEQNVAAILTGHMHSVIYDRYESDAGQVVWELRAPAAAQRDPQPALQGFWVHELACDDGTPRWNAWQYGLGPNKSDFCRCAGPLPIR
jgi:3',5'-cyclic AMP phosphodiesterase CpdA